MATVETESEKSTKRRAHGVAAKPKQTTIWIDGDLYEAMMLAKARGKGSLKKQVNGALRQVLGVEDTAALEEKERQAYAEKPWNEQDNEDVTIFDGSRALGDEWDDG